jgi:hypothetical protein
MRKFFISFLMAFFLPLFSWAFTQVGTANLLNGPITMAPSSFVTIATNGYQSMFVYAKNIGNNGGPLQKCLGFFGIEVNASGVTLVTSPYGELPAYQVDGVFNVSFYPSSFRTVPINKWSHIILYNEDAATTISVSYMLQSLTDPPGYNKQGFIFSSKNVGATGVTHPTLASDSANNGALYYSLQIADPAGNTYDACTVNLEGSLDGGNFAVTVLSMSVTGIGTNAAVTTTTIPQCLDYLRLNITSLSAGSTWNLMGAGH